MKKGKRQWARGNRKLKIEMLKPVQHDRTGSA